MDERDVGSLENKLYDYTKKQFSRGRKRSLEESFERALELIPEDVRDYDGESQEEWV